MRYLTHIVLAGLLASAPAEAQRKKTVPPPPSHDEQVAAVTNEALNRAFASPGSMTIAKRTDAAFGDVQTQRRGHSQDEVLRDAEYYLYALAGAAARNWSQMGAAAGAPAYNALKWLAKTCANFGFPELEERLRTNPNDPTSPPGGVSWAYRGLRDGVTLDGTTPVQVT